MVTCHWKSVFHKDIRTEGSGNLGGTNAGRVLGKKVGITVIVLDALKAFFSMLLASYITKDAMIYAGLACCIGHCFPIFAQFKGGKAVATSFGFFLGIATFINHQYFYQFFLPLLIFLVKSLSLSYGFLIQHDWFRFWYSHQFLDWKIYYQSHYQFLYYGYS